ncbi:MAG: BON domain-containing protein [Hoeflea sp.]|uniref:BON domain-containing protein n=1 Tax=Hoeflea sp. TaxID=1940281 RepID=UPI00272F6773|nr:BON domain-containing protein [Hoeflea sp.]MDP2118620.1 BON domain-containing protein [Hoeflea sp.]MDP3524082.1 BON domain-containing protein [Hoeflea sp.]MDZ7600563.1 BON domain-containing protein [Hoeflea sp.]
MVFKDRRFFGLPPETDVLPADNEQQLILSGDALLESDVASALANASEVDAVDVAVTATGGLVTLSGRVARTEEIARCAEIAERVEGVLRLRNRIGVWTPDA